MSNQEEEAEKGFDWIPNCFIPRPDGFCNGRFVNNYWSFKKCRYCSLFIIETCLNCKFMKWHGPHMACHHPELFGGRPAGKWLPRKDAAWMTRKKHIEEGHTHHACEKYERS